METRAEQMCFHRPPQLQEPEEFQEKHTPAAGFPLVDLSLVLGFFFFLPEVESREEAGEEAVVTEETGVGFTLAHTLPCLN